MSDPYLTEGAHTTYVFGTRGHIAGHPNTLITHAVGEEKDQQCHLVVRLISWVDVL